MKKDITDDTVKMYMQEISKYKLLDRDEEQRLARKIKKLQRILIARILESKLGRDAISEAADNYVKSNIKRSDLFEMYEDSTDDNALVSDSELVIKKTAIELIEKCQAYPIAKIKADILDDICNIHLASTLLANLCDLIDKKKVPERTKINRVNTNITKAKNELITKNLKLVVNIARDYRNRGVDYEDLIQEGNIGLMRAVNKFDYHKGTRFSTYAYWWVRQSITRSIAETSRMVRVPVYLVEHFYKVSKSLNDHISSHGKMPTVEDIAVKADLTLDQVKKALGSMTKMTSLDTVVSPDSDSMLGDVIEDRDSPNPEEMYIFKVQQMLLNEAIKEKLTPKEEKIIRLRFGLGDDYGDDLTLEDIGTKFGVTRERVRQIIHGSKNKKGIINKLAASSKMDNLRSLFKEE